MDEIRISVRNVEDQYLKLNEIGSVLHQLSHKLPGIYMYMYLV